MLHVVYSRDTFVNLAHCRFYVGFKVTLIFWYTIETQFLRIEKLV